MAVYPWDVSLSHGVPDDSRLNHVTAAVASVAPLGNRVRVQVGPLVAEITAASAERLELRPGVPVTATFKATASRLFPADGSTEAGRVISLGRYGNDLRSRQAAQGVPTTGACRRGAITA